MARSNVAWQTLGERIYLYLLLEFQSTIDRAMPVRIDDGLSPVLPIVLYNGDARWRHSAELYDAILTVPIGHPLNICVHLRNLRINRGI